MARSFLVVTSFVAAIAASSAARAESSPDAGRYCSLGYAPNRVSVPANLPALRVLRGSDVTGVTVRELSPESPVVTFETAETSQFTFFFPNAPLAVGKTYTIDFAIACARGTDTGMQPMEFQTTEEMALPTKIGTATVENDGPIPILAITPTRELRAYLEVVDFELHEEGALLNAYRLQRGDDKIRFAAPPAPTTCLEDDDLVREKTVRVSAHVIGASSYAESLEVPMLFDCRKSARAAKPPATRDDEGGGGCQTVPYSAPSAFFGGALTVFAFGVWRRRSRRRVNEMDRVRTPH